MVLLAAGGTSLSSIFMASLIADLTRKAVLHPVDTMAVKLQYDRGLHASTAAARLPLLNDAKALVRIVSGPGSVRSLYRGLGTSLLGAVPMSLVYMPTYELVSTALKAAKAGGLPWLPASQFASVATGVVCASVRVPVSMIKSRVQLGLAATPRDALTGALRNGIAGLYVGLSATVGLDITYALVQFTALEYFRALGLLLTGAVTCAPTVPYPPSALRPSHLRPSALRPPPSAHPPTRPSSLRPLRSSTITPSPSAPPSPSPPTLPSLSHPNPNSNPKPTPNPTLTLTCARRLARRLTSAQDALVGFLTGAVTAI